MLFIGRLTFPVHADAGAGIFLSVHAEIGSVFSSVHADFGADVRGWTWLCVRGKADASTTCCPQ